MEITDTTTRTIDLTDGADVDAILVAALTEARSAMQRIDWDAIDTDDDVRDHLAGEAVYIVNDMAADGIQFVAGGWESDDLTITPATKLTAWITTTAHQVRGDGRWYTESTDGRGLTEGEECGAAW